jgi:Tfp pilus assembly PilM family ATPase
MIPPDRKSRAQGFSPDAIVRAIEAVEKAGLEVCAMEITTGGSIKIVTGPRTRAAKTEASVDLPDEAVPTKARSRTPVEEIREAMSVLALDQCPPIGSPPKL